MKSYLTALQGLIAVLFLFSVRLPVEAWAARGCLTHFYVMPVDSGHRSPSYLLWVDLAARLDLEVEDGAPSPGRWSSAEKPGDSLRSLSRNNSRALCTIRLSEIVQMGVQPGNRPAVPRDSDSQDSRPDNARKDSQIRGRSRYFVDTAGQARHMGNEPRWAGPLRR